MQNRILLTDSYKATHAAQYEAGTTNVFSYFESRGGEFAETTFMGLQMMIKKYLLAPVTVEEVEYAFDRLGKHIGPAATANKSRWLRLIEKHGGRFPVTIRAVPEGTTVATKQVLMTVESTDPEFFWLVGHLEDLLVQLWYPTTVCTFSREMKRTILDGLKQTGTPDLIGFKLHDFGFRGVSSVESAEVGGLAHLVNFLGTDTMPALEAAKDYYGCDMAGYSIPAAEHSTITSWGRHREADAYANMLDQFPTGLVAVVSDSYDIENACRNIWGEQLRERVLARNGTVVVRPDSGEPDLTMMKVLRCLGEKFGTTINSKGYRVLPDQIRVIYGDGIDFTMLRRIIYTMKSEGWSVDNAAFGCGGGLLQKMNRDTQRFAFKCSSVVVNGEQRDVYKQPVGDTKKNSKRGRIKLVVDRTWQDRQVGPVFATVPESDPRPNELREVYRDGQLLIDETLDQIRERAALK